MSSFNTYGTSFLRCGNTNYDTGLRAIVDRLSEHAFYPPDGLYAFYRRPTNIECFCYESHSVKLPYRIGRMAGNFSSKEVAHYNKFNGNLQELVDALVQALEAALEEVSEILSTHKRGYPFDVEAIVVVKEDIPFLEKMLTKCKTGGVTTQDRKACFANIPRKIINAFYACLSLGNLDRQLQQSHCTPAIVDFFVLLKIFYAHAEVFGKWSNTGQVEVHKARDSRKGRRVCDQHPDESLNRCRVRLGDELQICRPCTQGTLSASKGLLLAFPACNHAKPEKCACNGKGHSGLFPGVLATTMREGSESSKSKIRSTVIGFYDKSESAKVMAYTRNQVMSLLDGVLSEQSDLPIENMRESVLLLCNMGLLAAGTMKVQLKQSEEGRKFLDELFHCDICGGPCFLETSSSACPWEVREAITKKFDPKLENIFCNMMEHFVRLQAGATIEPTIAYTVNGAFYMNTSTVMEHGHGGPRDRFVTRTTVHSDIWTLWNCQQAERLSEILTHEDWKRWETGFRDRCPGLLHGVANPCTI